MKIKSILGGKKMVKPVLKRTLKNGEKVYTLRVANGRLKSGKTKYSKRDVCRCAMLL